jgi:hypothetical protein
MCREQMNPGWAHGRAAGDRPETDSIDLAEEIGTDSVLAETTATHLYEAMHGVEPTTATTTRMLTSEVTPDVRQRIADAIRRTQTHYYS